jgi:hypothetical protein
LPGGGHKPIFAMDQKGPIRSNAKRDVQHRPLLRYIDLLAPKHALGSALNITFCGKRVKELQGLIRDDLVPRGCFFRSVREAITMGAK